MIRVGTVVRLKGKKRTAKVELRYNDIEGGVRLDRMLDGFYSWNVADLERAPNKNPRPTRRSISRAGQYAHHVGGRHPLV